ncbi:hypothetical protein SAMN02982929_03165 [Saccharopolyspora kobensis]|uniref:Excreted virulence factor EspC (Type VII ESX diderm) n=1 Tax=Saccharopolyspora kobensis TaxID=146035 RepID=A0A1H6C785_9PSEU|nr:hypothetical protein [Saccharopolyspora kobensis]SEG68485.1 hypothetical protein SAMN02982929_03165 [Saccharopolyspora kobensis]SFC30035.1 hypothetical protein SAMN05216506_101405 [Saccharopolyspora kobensis]
MGDGFRVDLPALTRAAEGVQDTIDSMNRKKVADIDCPSEAFGHDRLATTVHEYCDRWDQGVSNLTEDGQEIAGRLAHCVEVYRQTDEAARSHFEGILRRTTGDDPAAE